MRKRLEGFTVSDEVDDRTEVLWAVMALIVVAALIGGLALAYLRPVGRSEYRAELAESGGVVAGTEVRVAGIPVGSVTAVDLGADRVHVAMTVDSTIFVGDQTTLAVRMLTVVGGAYVALLPAGSAPLGTAPIPIERTAVPYSLPDVLDAAAGAAGEIDGGRMRDLTVSLTDSLKQAPGSVRNIVGDVDRLTALLNAQQNQISRTAELGAEYTTALAIQQQALVEMIGRIRAVLPVMVGYKDRGMATYAALGEMVLYVGDILGDPYQQRLAGPARELAGSVSAGREVAQRMDEAITRLRGLVDALAAVAQPTGFSLDFGDRLIDATSVCIPIAGRTC